MVLSIVEVMASTFMMMVVTNYRARNLMHSSIFLILSILKYIKIDVSFDTGALSNQYEDIGIKISINFEVF